MYLMMCRCGSSPRVRGKQRRSMRNTAHYRIIPASAGQTYAASPRTSHNADHPRECGANAHEHGVRPRVRGSSPRVRGKQGSIISLNPVWRIIPASAGQTGVPATTNSRNPDHPRECGANPNGVRGSLPLAGSSPRVRGKLRLLRIAGTLLRIIPASAGQTASDRG